MKFSSFIVEMDNMPPSEPQEVDKPVQNASPKILTPNKKLIVPRAPQKRAMPNFAKRNPPFADIPHDQLKDHIKDVWETKNKGKKIEDWRNLVDENKVNTKDYPSDDHIKRNIVNNTWKGWVPDDTGRGPYPKYEGNAAQEFLRGGRDDESDQALPMIHAMIESSERHGPYWNQKHSNDGDGNGDGSWYFNDHDTSARSYFRAIAGAYDKEFGEYDPFVFGALREGDQIFDPGFSSISSDIMQAGDFLGDIGSFDVGEGQPEPIMMDIFGPEDWNEYDMDNINNAPNDHRGLFNQINKPGQGERILMPNVPLTYRGRGHRDDYNGVRPYLFDMPGYKRWIPEEYPKTSGKELYFGDNRQYSV